MTFQPRHLLVAVTLHILLFGLMAGGAQCTRKVPVPVVMEAVLYDPSRQQLAETRKAEERRREQERKRQAEDAKKKQAEAEEKARVEAREREALEKRKAEEIEKKRKADELAQKKKEEQERLKKEQKAKLERQEQEKRAAEMKAQMQREIEQENLRRQMEQEAQALRQSELKGRINEWGARVTAHIRKNWIRPSGADDFSCTVQVQLLPDGTVTAARIVRSCGSPVLNKSVEDAVYRSSPIPRPDDPAAFTRDLTINFAPQ